MNSIKEISPCFDKGKSVTDSKEFIQTFCVKALELLKEFKSAYKKAIAAQQISDLDSITHKISSTMKWLDLDEFVSLTQSYKDFSISDQTTMEDLLVEVTYYSSLIEDSIRRKLVEM
jgi:hypothetical protein